MVTVFTPTYNRAYILSALYKSLVRQTNKSFEWLVIDDGSTDNTEALVKSFIAEDKINIRYIYKENGGKHTAANVGLNEAQGELFFVVDSDDFLTDNAIERIFFYYDQIKDDDGFCGVCGMKSFVNGKVIGGGVDYDVLDSTVINYRFRYGYTGDKAEVFKTALLKQYRYPEYKKEKWCPLSLIWNRIGGDRKLRYFNESIYMAEYLPDGISLNRLKIRKNSPNLTITYYAELAHNPRIPLKARVKAAINYWRFAFYSEKSLGEKIAGIGIINTLLFGFGGYLFYLFDNSEFLHKHFLDPKKKILKEQAK